MKLLGRLQHAEQAEQAIQHEDERGVFRISFQFVDQVGICHNMPMLTEDEADEVTAMYFRLMRKRIKDAKQAIKDEAAKLAR